ncbi:transcriptional regulator [Actinocatenispora thailandica]|uniref:Transcriptional regulator n=1 Tax=Actinocatenispora thailandica TaxID=227318 RepID=A0A7R7DL10_9ACTN|nr:helix-turn-helix transcriptional regulator [Actinocatenispora thailandica]BCJ33521.1 transcriptional regulator [Actinocatenispora thailandica]
MFEPVGLSTPDSRLYAALVAAPGARGGELAAEVGLPVAAVTRRLARLIEAGLASRLPGRPARYLAAAPDVAIADLIGRREDELRDARADMHRLMDTYRQAARFTHPDQSVEVLVGREAIAARVVELHATARVQVRGFDKPPYLMRSAGATGGEHRRIREGVRYRVLYDRGALTWPGRLAGDIAAGQRAGEQARSRPALPLKMMLVDDRVALVPITTADRPLDSMYLIHRSSLLDALAALFEAEWDRGTPLGPAPAAGELDPPDPDSRRLLTLLVSGATDAGIARALGISPRTTQRRLRDLFAQLGVTTRFQAGAAAQSRGWL